MELEPPIFGQNGAVLNASTMTVEMRREIQEREQTVSIQYSVIGAVMSLVLGVCFIIQQPNEFGWVSVLLLVAIVGYFFWERSNGVSGLRSFWRALPLLACVLILLNGWVDSFGRFGALVPIILLVQFRAIERIFFPLRDANL